MRKQEKSMREPKSKKKLMNDEKHFGSNLLTCGLTVLLLLLLLELQLQWMQRLKRMQQMQMRLKQQWLIPLLL